ncbi:sodium:calcium antiporter, partial [Candidatus Dojkabacteria bacterium]|nr:sodium:calcium antiporter [Candidatus Dojkabacteria bacterium]
MQVIAYLLLIILFTFLLVKSADLVEEALVLIARKAGVSTFVIGFVIVSIASSLPEMSVALGSSAEGVPALSVGNLLGASLVLLTLIVALNTFRHGTIPFRGSFHFRQVAISMLVIFSQVVVLLDQYLSREEGFLLIIIYLLFVLYITRNSTSGHKHLHMRDLTDVKFLKVITTGIFGLISLIIFAALTVTQTVELAALVHVPNSVVGILLLAIGTNIPEIAIIFRSRNSEEEKLAVGNILGSAAINTGTLGLLGIIASPSLPNYVSLIPAITFLVVTLIV